MTTRAEFEKRMAAAISQIKLGIQKLDELSNYEASPTDAQFTEIKKLRDQLSQHVWQD